MAIVCILLNSIIMYYASKDSLLRNKGKVIACSVMSIFTAAYTIIELLAIVNIIVMASSKRVNPEDFPPPKEKLPILEKEKVDKSKILEAVILLLIYFSQFIWADFLPKKGAITITISIIFYLLMITVSIIFFKDLLKNNFKEFKNHFKAYRQNLLPLLGKYYLAYIFVAIIAALLCKEMNSANQESIMKLPIWYSLPLAVIYAPIVEEILFRGCLRRFIKNDKVFIAISAIVFGLLHTVFSEATLYNTIVMALPYMTIGCFLAYVYAKTNNILCNMSFHCFHNTIAMILMILIIKLEKFFLCLFF